MRRWAVFDCGNSVTRFTLVGTNRDRSMFRELDWNASARRVKLGMHWRMLFCALLFIIFAIFVWNWLYPNTFWFMKLWAGLATGTFAGIIFGGIWQLCDHRRWPHTSGWFLLAGTMGMGIFASIAIVMFVPEFRDQELERSKIRSLKTTDIAMISVRVPGRGSRVIKDFDSIAMLISDAQHAELFFPSHERSVLDFQLTINLVNGVSLAYEARIPERHKDDMSLRFHAYFAMNELIVPGGRRWLDRVISEIPTNPALQQMPASGSR